MKTWLFEVVKNNLMKSFEKQSECITEAKVVRFVKSKSDTNKAADVEYQIKVRFNVNDNEEKVTIKVFTTKEYLGNEFPTGFLFHLL